MSEVTDAPRAAANEDQRVSPQGSPIWYELMTPDPAGASAFYEAVVPGWKFGDRMGGDQDYRMIGRSDGGNAGGMLGLTDEMRQHGARPIWLGYIGADDVDATVAKIEAKGGKALMPAFDIPEVGRIAMVADPQGAPFYVMKPIPPAGNENKVSDVFSPSEEQRVGWNELSTSDPAAARAFYEELFGWTANDFMPMPDNQEYRFIDHAGVRLGAIYGSSSGAFSDEQPHWRFYIRVPSIGQAKTSIEAGGGTVKMGPMEVPGGDHIIIGTDPQGAEFALVGKA